MNRGWTVIETFHPNGAAMRVRRKSIAEYGLRFLYCWEEVKVVEDWAAELNITPKTIHKKLNAGWSAAQILNPVAGRKRVGDQIRARWGKYLTYQGKTQVIAEWARELGMMRITLRERLKAGWSVERALSTPVSKKKPKRPLITFKGKTQSAAAWGREVKIREYIIRSRLDAGWPVGRALSVPDGPVWGPVSHYGVLDDATRKKVALLAEAIGQRRAARSLSVGTVTMSRAINHPEWQFTGLILGKLSLVLEWYVD